MVAEDFQTNMEVPAQAMGEALNSPTGILATTLVPGPFDDMARVGMAGRTADEAFGALSDGMRMGTDDALNTATDVLGSGYNEVAPGVFRSADGNYQVRMTDSDIAGRGTGGEPHMNFERGQTVTNPATGRQTFEVDENVHVLLPEERRP